MEDKKDYEKFLSNIFPILKIKALFQKNKKIGKIIETIPSMISRSMEMLLIDIFSETNVLVEKKKKKIKTRHFDHIIRKIKRFRKISKIKKHKILLENL
ncbi:hypothetical protein CMESO_551 (nucleomorph) [Chroomonas mesostigmatica CCMP1168]|uniref:Transcription factor CBF/NF-Y/archaeal histone domain-containing protein n=1 Tax=Chroomonas mesostigmatica CCMP1168 TaxID=1195612 RepID=J7G6L5_9CRYP|nr:hypothetical protein CMESO_551 [Chroomonas mesostigmatica CCMP1168]